MYLYVDSFEGLSRDEVLQKTFDERSARTVGPRSSSGQKRKA